MAAKLLLIEDVEDLGRSGEIVNVKPGYARNFLLPRGFAVIADKGTVRMQTRLQKEREERAAQDKAEALKSAEQLSSITLSTIVKVDHEGHMYGSVSAHDIVELLKAQANIDLEKRAITLKHPIKEVGVHTIHLKLKEGVTSTLTLKVMSEEEQNAPEAPAEA